MIKNIEIVDGIIFKITKVLYRFFIELHPKFQSKQENSIHKDFG